MSRVLTAFCADDGRPVAALEAELRPHEQVQAQAHAGRRRRHFILGRLAAHSAIHQLGVGATELWIAADTVGAPAVAGSDAGVAISIAHSGLLAIACAWATQAGRGRRIGIDVERLRPTDIASSRYAFSPRERQLVRATDVDGSCAGLLAWVAKEAAWKAIRFSADVGPDALEVRGFDPDGLTATVIERRRREGEHDARKTFLVRLRVLAGPDGEYVVALARERTGR